MITRNNWVHVKDFDDMEQRYQDAVEYAGTLEKKLEATVDKYEDVALKYLGMKKSNEEYQKTVEWLENQLQDVRRELNDYKEEEAGTVTVNMEGIKLEGKPEDILKTMERLMSLQKRMGF